MLVRLARLEEAPALRELIEASIRGLQTGHYTPNRAERAFDLVGV